MDHHQGGALTEGLARRFTRRAALLTGGAAVGTATVGLATAGRAAAQDATPFPVADLANPEFLFVQIAEGGAWAPKPGEDGGYLVTLSGVWAQTIYFSDRPERIVGTTPTERFLQGLGFTPANPPNAAIVAQTADGEDVVVVELLNPAYDADAGTLIYEARLLDGADESGLTVFTARQADAELPAEFGATSLFIDDCPDRECDCLYDGQLVGKIDVGYCWHFPNVICDPCHNTAKACNETFNGCHANCTSKCP